MRIFTSLLFQPPLSSVCSPGQHAAQRSSNVLVQNCYSKGGGHYPLALRHHQQLLRRIFVALNNAIAEDADAADDDYRPENNMMMTSRNSSFSFPTTLANWTSPSLSAATATTSIRPPVSKADLYTDNELQSLLDLHQQLSWDTTRYKQQPLQEESEEFTSEATSFSIHDLVMQTLNDANSQLSFSTMSPLQVDDEEETATYNTDPKQVQQILPKIRAIASDVDGTLLSSSHTLHPRTKAAVLKAVQVAAAAASDPTTTTTIQHFFLATGKTRAGALASLGPELAAVLSKVPGVYSQGLYCVNAQGVVVYERRLNQASVRAAVEMGLQYNLSVIGYNGDSIAATPNSDPQHVYDVHFKYGEPMPIVMETPEAFVTAEHGWNKLLLMHDDDDKLKQVYRPLLDDLAVRYNASTTQAVPNMLELLPAGCSKAVGVQKLCEVLGIDPRTELMAIGDGENDGEMLEMAACGIAVGNAVTFTKDRADVVLTATNNEGGAGIAIEQYGLDKKILGGNTKRN